MELTKIERQVEANHNRRMANEARMLERQEREYDKRWNKADAMIGELIRDGKKVFYVMPIGGKYRENTRSNLISFLMRNNYA